MLIFKVKKFQFPYQDLKFPGQYSEEKILFVTREGKIVLISKLILVVMIFFFVLIFGIWLLNSVNFLNFNLAGFTPIFILVWTGMTTGAIWWLYKLWQQTVFIITTRRLTKFIHTTPWTRYQMSLGLDQIVDTGAYCKGFFQMITGLGYFVARSAAGSEKNFKIINIAFSEDLHNYVNKLLFVFNEHKKQLDKFRPFIPGLKGEARDEYVRKVAPQFSKPIKFAPEAEAEYLKSGQTIYQAKIKSSQK